MTLYDRLMRFSKGTLFSMALEAGVKPPRGYCWVEGGRIDAIPPNEGGPWIPGASKDDAARALAAWLSATE